MKIVYSAEAREDFSSIGLWIAEDNSVRAASFVDELHYACEALSPMPRAFPILLRRRGVQIRRTPFGSYLIFYRITRESIEILRVLHAARDYERLL